MNSSDAMYIFIGLFILIILFLLFTSPKTFFRVFLHALSGIATLLLLRAFGLGVSLNIVSTSVSAILGIPGAVTALAIQQIL